MNNKLMKIVPKPIFRKVSRQILLAKKHSPHIFFVGGILGVGTSTVLACRSTLKLSDTLDEIKKDIDNQRGRFEEVDVHLDYSPQDWHYDTFYIYGKASVKIIRLYGPALLIGVAAIGALTGSHVQMTRRNTALMAAYAAVQKAYDDYRERVRAQYGEDNEHDLYHAVDKYSQVENADGKKELVATVDPSRYSAYAKFFDEFSRFWNRDPEINRMFVQCQQNYANNLLHARGHVFLNEIYDMLGVERSRAGAVVGWVREGEGDGYIDFGIFEAFNSAFVNGHERSILLDFNVDGVIYDKI